MRISIFVAGDYLLEYRRDIYCKRCYCPKNVCYRGLTYGNPWDCQLLPYSEYLL